MANSVRYVAVRPSAVRTAGGHARDLPGAAASAAPVTPHQSQKTHHKSSVGQHTTTPRLLQSGLATAAVGSFASTASATACTPLMNREAAASVDLVARIRQRSAAQRKAADGQDGSGARQWTPATQGSIFKKMPLRRQADGTSAAASDTDSDSDSDDDVDLATLTRRHSVGATATTVAGTKRRRLGMVEAAMKLRGKQQQQQHKQKKKVVAISGGGIISHEIIAPAKNNSYEYGY